ncbi:MAG: hypothetical protein E6I77_07160 [Chloroflexi bacterium]|nr:MAG: hypothetical protein E6I77_07160 [Chloroflexota bacterium]
MRIAVDAMGGDNAPEQVLQGATQAADEMGIDIAIVGLPGSVQPLLDKHPKLVLVPCTQVIGMDEHPAQAVRSKPDSSMSVCAHLCKAGRADGWISAGNSGAIMATALFVQGRIRGVERPALGSVIPTRRARARGRQAFEGHHARIRRQRGAERPVRVEGRRGGGRRLRRQRGHQDGRGDGRVPVPQPARRDPSHDARQAWRTAHPRRGAAASRAHRLEGIRRCSAAGNRRRRGHRPRPL